jgi:hypothetical protein
MGEKRVLSCMGEAMNPLPNNDICIVL